MAYRIVHCRWESGERYCMLVEDETGLPPWYPMLFVTTQLRNAARSVATMEAALGAIQLLLEHTDAQGIDLEQRVLKREFLATHEIETLCDQAQLRRNAGHRDQRTVSVGHHYKRLSFIATYLEWFVREVLDNRRSRDDDRAVDEMVRKINSRRPEWNSKGAERDRALTDEQLQRLMEVLDPSHPDNPFNDERAAIRNQLAVLMLARLGVRKGELLAVQVGDIDWGARQLRIERRPDDDHDPRTRQPRAKTLARRLTLFPELIERLRHYIMGARRSTKRANTHRYLLVVHREGPDEGQPLSESGLDKVFKTLRRCDPLLASLHPHAMRHTWNWQFSRAMDEMPEERRPSHEEQESMRSHDMGWVEGSGTARAYNRRFIEEKANEAALELAERPTKGSEREPGTEPA